MTQLETLLLTRIVLKRLIFHQTDVKTNMFSSVCRRIQKQFAVTLENSCYD